MRVFQKSFKSVFLILLFSCGIACAQDGGSVPEASKDETTPKAVSETKDQLKARLLANVKKQPNGDVEIAPLPNPNAPDISIASKAYAFYIYYMDPSLDPIKYEKEVEKARLKEQRGNLPLFIAIDAYMSKKKLGFEKIQFKSSAISALIKKGVPVYAALNVPKAFLEHIEKRQEEREALTSMKAWGSALKKSEKQILSDLARAPADSRGMLVIGFNPDTKEYLVQLPHLEDSKTFWMSENECEAALVKDMAYAAKL